MASFASTEQLHQIMVELWEAIKNDKDMFTKITTSKLIAQFHYRDPAGIISVDCSDGKTFKVFSGECNVKPVVEMFMTADVAHEFWNGKVNVPIAILTGKMVAKGPVNKALALLPVLKPAFEIYPDIYRRHTNKTPVSG
jgi:hypothetical protein